MSEFEDKLIEVLQKIREELIKVEEAIRDCASTKMERR